MGQYNNFAFFYDELTKNVDYKKRADFYLEKLNENGHKPGLTLDLACGTGGLLFELIERGIDAFGADASISMLNTAKDKGYERNLELLLICQKMEELELYAPVDTIMCMLDGVNHLSSFSAIEKTFAKTYEYLNNGGVFIFDMNTVYKHREVLGDNTFIYDMPDVFCTWQNEYEEQDNRVNMTLDFFAKQGNAYKRYTDEFSEIAFSEEKIETALRSAGYSDVIFYPCPSEEKERMLILAIR